MVVVISSVVAIKVASKVAIALAITLATKKDKKGSSSVKATKGVKVVTNHVAVISSVVVIRTVSREAIAHVIITIAKEVMVSSKVDTVHVTLLMQALRKDKRIAISSAKVVINHVKGAISHARAVTNLVRAAMGSAKVATDSSVRVATITIVAVMGSVKVATDSSVKVVTTIVADTIIIVVAMVSKEAIIRVGIANVQPIMIQMQNIRSKSVSSIKRNTSTQQSHCA